VPLQVLNGRRIFSDHHIGIDCNKFCRRGAHVDAEVAAVGPTQFAKFLAKCANKDDVVLANQKADPALLLGLLGERRKRPRATAAPASVTNSRRFS
jgi:hypothetical protein